MKTLNDQTSWLHIFALVALSGGGGAISMRQYERLTAPAPSAIEQMESRSDRADQVRQLTEALTHLRQTVDKFQPSVEKLSDTVQELSRKVAVIEDRQERDRRLPK